MSKSLPAKFVLYLFLIFSSWVQADPSFSRLYVFGDSLSDTGNLASITNPFPAPYYNNRVSNGRVAVETLADRLGLSADASLHFFPPATGTNYAVARANAFGNEVIDLSAQVISFQANHNSQAPEDALYVMFIGGNDVRDALYFPDTSGPKAMVKDAAKQVQQAISSLYQSGARWFLLINAPNIGVIPETKLVADDENDPELIKQARKLSKLYRNQLHQVVDQLEENTDLNIVEFDLFKFFNKLVKKADSYGFTNATDACFMLELIDDILTPVFHPECNFDQFVFFDEIHPTARVHALVGEAFYEAVMEMDD